MIGRELKITEIIQRKTDLETYYNPTNEKSHGSSRVERQLKDCKEDVPLIEQCKHS